MAAGLGFKEFTTGDVLTAADANGYLASQVVMVFANAAARTSAIASPQEGMISYLKDTNATEYYSGSAWVAIGGSTANGLTLISATPCSAVSSQSVTGFSSTYNNYRILFSGDGSADDSVFIKLRSGGSDSSTAYYGYTNRYFSSNATQTAVYSNGTSGLEVAQSMAASVSAIDVFRPFEAQRTSIIAAGTHFKTSTSVSSSIYTSGIHDVQSSFDGFTLNWFTSSFTGTIYLYGYQKA